MRRWVLTALLLAGCVAATHPAAAQEPRPSRLGNINIVLGGVGFATFDHPNFSDDLFPAISYQRRILRRESRSIPIWIRGALNFLVEDRRFEGYTIWQEGELTIGEETVQEHTSDFTIRAELLADVLSTKQAALYGGAGFAIHYVSFSSNGLTSQIPVFEDSQNIIAPSLCIGGRVWSVQHAITVYGEARWGRAYGRNDPTPPDLWLTDQTYDITDVAAVFFEVGAGFHW